MSVWFPHFNPFGLGLHFLIGIPVGLVLTLWKRERHTHLLWDFAWLTLVGILGALLWEVRDLDDFAYSIGHMPFRFPIAALLIAGIIAILPATRILSHFFETRVFRHIAKISYSAYLWHALVMVLLGRYFFDNMGNLPIPDWFWLMGMTFGITWIIAWLSYALLEVRLSKWLV